MILSIIPKSILPQKINTNKNIFFKGNINKTELLSDSYQPSASSAQIINEKLYQQYQIQSDIDDPALLYQIYQTIKDYCEINDSNDLFAGLKIRTDAIDDTIFENRRFEEQTITFNKNFNFKYLPKYTKKLYEKGMIPTDNPLYILYLAFGDYLLYKTNPKTYNEQTDKYVKPKDEYISRFLTNTARIDIFNKNYLAAKMSGVNLPDAANYLFIKNRKDCELKFPDGSLPFAQKEIPAFKSMQEIKEYLKKLGIKAKFPSPEVAKYFAEAIYEIIKLIGDDKIFKGLKIKPWQNNATKLIAALKVNHRNPKKACIVIRTNYDWSKQAEKSKIDYNCCYHPYINPRYIFVHELAHYLDWKANPKAFNEVGMSFQNKERKMSDYEKMVAQKVSNYATTSTIEFCAEYIAGKTAGINYPTETDEMFRKNWHGIKINFSNNS